MSKEYLVDKPQFDRTQLNPGDVIKVKKAKPHSDIKGLNCLITEVKHFELDVTYCNQHGRSSCRIKIEDVLSEVVEFEKIS